VEKIINSRGLVDKGGESIHKMPRYTEKPHHRVTGGIDTPCRGWHEAQGAVEKQTRHGKEILRNRV